MLKKLRIQFVCINMTIFLLMLGIIFGLLLHFTRQNLESESVQMMQALALAPVQPDRPDMPSEQVRLPYFTLQLGARGEIILKNGGFYDLSDEAFLHDLVEATITAKSHTGILQDYNLRFCRVVTPDAQYVVFADISSEMRTMEHLIQNCLLVGLASSLVFLLISSLLALWTVRPVEEAWKQQRQFVADASHELKTPLTVILANAELLRLPDYDDADRTQLSDGIYSMARQMQELVTRLLELARAERGGGKTELVPLNLSQLVSDAIDTMELFCQERDRSITRELQPDLYVKGDPAGLLQVTDILLDNAVKYSEPQSDIRVSLAQQGRHCVLSVASVGNPLSKADLKNVFKRFYRVDKSRSARGSYGLGLSIAAGLVQQHRGKIWAECSGNRNTFFVRLRLSSAAKPRRRERDIEPS